jgi:glycosyltransferase involved in cell wall biosynthesis
MLPAISVVIPAFNEAVRIGDTLATTIAYLERESPGSELIVINDGSTDATGQVIRKVAAVPSTVAIRLLENFPNRGKGAAVRTGLLNTTRPIAVFSMQIFQRQLMSFQKLLNRSRAPKWILPLVHARLIAN